MIRWILLLSGHVCAGKSTLCELLVRSFGAQPLKTKDELLGLMNRKVASRTELQALGERLDRQTKGNWPVERLSARINQFPPQRVVVIDSVRIARQIYAFRKAYGRRVCHIHLTAPLKILEGRYSRSSQEDKTRKESYRQVLQNQTEKDVDNLKDIADAVIDTSHNTVEDVLVRAASALGLYSQTTIRLVDVVVGGQYGSEGKGNIVSYLAPEYNLLIRVGGPNAGHRVFEEPEPFTFHQLPSGTRNSEARLLIGPGAVIAKEVLLDEISKCNVEHTRLRIDSQALIILPEDITRERILVEEIGSTGQGVGAATARRILHRTGRGVMFAKDIRELKPFIDDAYEILEKAYADEHKILLEGTQGTGLSLYHGPYPHVTSRDTSAAGCMSEAGISPSRIRRVVMVCRTYPIRVESPKKGTRTSGPLNEISWREVSRRSGVSYNELVKTEKTSTTQRRRRVGEFDWKLLREAAALNGPTDIALTFVDYISAANRDARRFEQLTPETIWLVEEIERVTSAPVSLISTSFQFRNIIDRRTWKGQ